LITLLKRLSDSRTDCLGYVHRLIPTLLRAA